MKYATFLRGLFSSPRYRRWSSVEYFYPYNDNADALWNEYEKVAGKQPDEAFDMLIDVVDYIYDAVAFQEEDDEDKLINPEEIDYSYDKLKPEYLDMLESYRIKLLKVLEEIDK